MTHPCNPTYNQCKTFFKIAAFNVTPVLFIGVKSCCEATLCFEICVLLALRLQLWIVCIICMSYKWRNKVVGLLQHFCVMTCSTVQGCALYLNVALNGKYLLCLKCTFTGSSWLDLFQASPFRNQHSCAKKKVFHHVNNHNLSASVTWVLWTNVSLVALYPFFIICTLRFFSWDSAFIGIFFVNFFCHVVGCHISAVMYLSCTCCHHSVEDFLRFFAHTHTYI